MKRMKCHLEHDHCIFPNQYLTKPRSWTMISTSVSRGLQTIISATHTSLCEGIHSRSTRVTFSDLGDSWLLPKQAIVTAEWKGSHCLFPQSQLWTTLIPLFLGLPIQYGAMVFVYNSQGLCSGCYHHHTSPFTEHPPISISSNLF